MRPGSLQLRQRRENPRLDDARHMDRIPPMEAVSAKLSLIYCRSRRRSRCLGWTFMIASRGLARNRSGQIGKALRLRIASVPPETAR